MWQRKRRSYEIVLVALMFVVVGCSGDAATTSTSTSSTALSPSTSASPATTTAASTTTGSTTAPPTTLATPVPRPQIAFECWGLADSDICVMDADGSNLTKLAFDVFDEHDPVFSPDGSRIVFVWDGLRTAEIYVMDIDGSSFFNLTNNPAAREEAPTWSPDGTRIAFESYAEGPDESALELPEPEIYVMDADGSNPTNLTNNPASDRRPAWSPDGSRIAFENFQDGNLEVYVMDADGSNLTNLTTDTGSDGGPAWSPDGSQIAFSSHRDGNWEIYVMDADGSNPTNLTNHPSEDYDPVWSPDGSRIAFSSGRDGAVPEGSTGSPRPEVFVMDTDGSNVINLTKDPNADELWHAWSPDGARIVFASARSGLFNVLVMDADGSNTTQLTVDGVNTGPVWSPAP